MLIPRHFSAALVCTLTATLPLPAPAQTASTGSGQAWPVKPIRMINGFPAGGGTDIMVRLLLPKMVEALGQQVLIENRAGASTNIAMDYVVKAQIGRAHV